MLAASTDTENLRNSIFRQVSLKTLQPANFTLNLFTACPADRLLKLFLLQSYLWISNAPSDAGTGANGEYSGAGTSCLCYLEIDDNVLF